MHDWMRWRWVGAGGLLALAVLGLLLAALAGFALPVHPAVVQAAPAVDDPITGLTITQPSTALVGISASFAATVTGGTNISYSWDFGDGGTGSGVTTTHVYSAPGVYTATVTATNDASDVSAQALVYVGDAVVEVRNNVFVSQHVTIDPGDTVLWVLVEGFHSVTADDASFDQPVGTDWPPYFHTFGATGVYTYHCTAHGAPGGIGMFGTVTVDGAADEPIAGLSIAGPATTPAGVPVTFTASVTAGTNISYSWDHGDGSGATGNPTTHSYTTPGSYTVTVTATNSLGPVSAQRSIQVLPEVIPLSGLAANSDSPTLLGDPTNFVANVTAGDEVTVTYSWDFGDGSTGSGKTPTHTYASVGRYTATVTASNAAGSEQATTVVEVGNVVVEVRDFSYQQQNVTVPVGGRVVWVLVEGFHSVTADDGSFEQPIGSDWPPFGHTFATTGQFAYHCSAHGSAGPGGGIPGTGMVGTVQVGQAAPEQELYLPNVVRP